jgi:pimeloyl-ACP methyl ester carboxylesterase
MIKSDLRTDRPEGGSLHLHYRDAGDGEARPTVILSHGFTVDGTESHRIFLRMANRYNAAGITTVNFDYFGCGYSDGDFSEFSLSNAVADLDLVIDWAQRQPGVDPERLVIHGQSLGTAVATVVGSRRDDVGGYVMWNLSADLRRRYTSMLGDELFSSGSTCIRDKGFRVTMEFMEDLQQYDILGYYRAWQSPTLFISSGADTKGEPALAEKACYTIGALGSRVVIPGANHSFKCQPDLEEQAAAATLSWVFDRFGPTASG